MRNVVMAILVLTPSLLHAQANTPAQPVLQAHFAASSTLPAADTKNAPAAATPSPVRISTGVVAPRLLKPVEISSLPGSHENLLANDAVVVISMTVDANGNIVNPTIAQSANATLDQQVLAALGQTRYQPGTLDGQPYPLPVRLQVTVQRGTRY